MHHLLFQLDRGSTDSFRHRTIARGIWMYFFGRRGIYFPLFSLHLVRPRRQQVGRQDYLHFLSDCRRKLALQAAGFQIARRSPNHVLRSWSFPLRFHASSFPNAPSLSPAHRILAALVATRRRHDTACALGQGPSRPVAHVLFLPETGLNRTSTPALMHLARNRRVIAPPASPPRPRLVSCVPPGPRAAARRAARRAIGPGADRGRPRPCP